MTVPRRISDDSRTRAFERIRRAFRWSVVASLGAVAAVFGAVAHEIPGRTAHSTTTSGSSTSIPASGRFSGTGNSGSTNSRQTGGTGSTGSTGSASSSQQVAPPTSTNRAPAAVSGGTSW
jgi:hypothetical protein